MSIEMYPTKFEAIDPENDDRTEFTIEMFDECSATVKMDTLVTVAAWDEISTLVRKALVEMKLEA